MIKEILLSLAVAAFSGVSSFVGGPKRAYNSLAEVNGDYYIYCNGSTFRADFPSGQDVDMSITPNQYFDWQDYNERPNKLIGGEWNTNSGTFQLTLTFFFENEEDAEDLSTNQNNYFSLIPNGANNGLNDGTDYYPYGDDGYVCEYYWTWSGVGDTLDEAFWEFRLTTRPYQLTKNFVNCDIASSPRLPDNFTSSSQLSYYVLMVSNAGGYGFTSESVTQTGGITIRNFNLFDQYNNSGYYASCSFNVDLPLNDCSITIRAFLPEYTITAALENCTVSPSIPASYTGTSFSGDYTFTAVSGYGFNKNYTHWEVTNLFVDSVEFSSLLWGSFYSSVTLHLRASGGNSSISVTAIKYDEESYKLGYEEGREDGWQAGYDRGHADGEIAGDSYGVWNWLKQAAITTGEFLSIPLLPGFSIGGLLTALAGLVIIWFFIRGFLFKS